MTRTEVHTFIVTVPATISKRDAKRYISEAVRGWVGGGDPDHPYYGELHHKNAVSVHPVPKVRS